jgi:hypothetical protein
MLTLKQARFIAANFPNLQGLKVLPLGVCLLVVSLWANAQPNAVRDWRLVGPVLAVAVAFGLQWILERYYARRFGLVERTPVQRRREWVLGAFGALFAFVAFYLDATLRRPVSLLGLIYAAVLLAEYARLRAQANGPFLNLYLLAALLLLVLSLLPLVGAPDWWQAFGLHNDLVAMTALFGVLTIVLGVAGHLFLVRALPLNLEAHNGQPL